MKQLIFIFLILSSFALSKELIQTGTSVSHFYEARSLFTNPAALAFEKELNGNGFSTSLSWARESQNNEGALGISWGNWGLGFEKNRFLLGSSLSLSSWLFLGSRVSFSDTTQWDGGIQIRPSRYFSFGILVSQLQDPDSLVVGATFRPLKPLTLSFDFENRDTFQANLLYELLPGFLLQTGYDREAQWHFGFQFNFNHTSLFSTGRSQPSQSIVAHAHWSHRPKRSSLHSTTAVSTKIDASLTERGNKGSLFQKQRSAFSQLLWDLEKWEADKNIHAVFISIDEFPLGYGSANELYEALWKLRQSGKKIVVSLSSPRLKDYLIASVAHHISLAPSGSLELLGPKTERYYFKGTLEQIGIEAEVIAKGKYKSAPEAFNRKGASDLSRENIFENLKEAQSLIEKLVQRSGRIKEENWKKARALGILSGKKALNLGWVDEIKEARLAERDFQNTYLAQPESSEFYSTDLALKPQIAVIVASGDIVRRKVGLLNILGADQLTAEELGEQMERAAKNPRVKAVIVRVSSGGGDVLASHLMGNQIRDLNRIKPVVVSMGDVAASGGYFISAPSQFTSASPLTVTGSIGVFSGKPNLSSLFKKLDLKKEVFSLSPYPRLFDEASGWTPEERKIVERQVEDYYETFLNYVSEHRKIDLAQVGKMAEGRVWLGKMALEGKLIDSLGGFSASVQKAKSLAELDEFEFKLLYPTIPVWGGFDELLWLKSELPQILGIASNNDLKI